MRLEIDRDNLLCKKTRNGFEITAKRNDKIKVVGCNSEYDSETDSESVEVFVTDPSTGSSEPVEVFVSNLSEETDRLVEGFNATLIKVIIFLLFFAVLFKYCA